MKQRNIIRETVETRNIGNLETNPLWQAIKDRYNNSELKVLGEYMTLFLTNRRQLETKKFPIVSEAWFSLFLNHPYLFSPSQVEPWKQLRKEVLYRDSFKCVLCGTMGNLNIHHVRRGMGITIRDLVTLCPSCHGKVEHGYGGPAYWLYLGRVCYGY